jgi:tRNA-specific 2-thiouridylase
LAEKMGLPISKVPESQEICFIQTTLSDFLRRHLGEEPGKMMDKEGKVLGEHLGLWFYTIGQRKGLGLTGGPWWVWKKNLKKKFLILTREKRDLLEKKLVCHQVNWISGKEPSFPLKLQAKIRYRQELVGATLKKIGKKLEVNFDQAQKAITPGQSVVFYLKDQLLGGGIIF